MSIAVGLVTGGEVRWECTHSLIVAGREKAYDEFSICPNHCQVDVGRNALVRWFLEQTDCDKFLSLDSDVAFVPTDLARLAEDDLDCVAGIYYNVFDGVLQPVVKLLADTPIVDDPVMEVEGVGAGFLMLSRNLLEKMAATYGEPMPWFHEPIIDGEHFGEDFGLCHRVRELGFGVHIDFRVQLAHYKTVRVTGPILASGRPG